MERIFLILAGVSGALAVIAGAFGGHALKQRLTPEMLAIYQTSVQYHLIHALALGLAAWVASRTAGPAGAVAGWSFFVGIVLFSGSLYVLTLSGIRTLGMITPLGGVAFIIGWLSLAWAAW